MGKSVIDTNVLLDSPEILDKLDNIILCSSVLEEIDGLKKSDNHKVSYQARIVNRKIEKMMDNITFIIKDIYDNIPEGWDVNKRDNKIIMCARDNSATLFSNDINVRIKAKSIGVHSQVWCESNVDKIYTGYKRLKGDTNFVNKLFEDIDNGINEYDFVVNEYLILENQDLNKIDEFRFNGVKFVDLKLPPSKIIKGLNPEQRCLLDLLNNKEITICGALGCWGSGKTYMSLKMALYHVQEKGNYSKILAVREPVSDSKDIGFLKGTFEEKTEHFFKPIQHSLSGGEFEMKALMSNGVLESNIPYFMRGTTYTNTYVIVDEAEDLSEKQLQMIGTRLGNGSAISFCGDYKQAVKNATLDNPLIKMCNKLKGNPSFGCIVLPEDVRSHTSKIFAELWN
jgi:PhoH-like ATPase